MAYTNDPFKAAQEAARNVLEGTYFGQVEITAEFVRLAKGQPPVAWDEELHDIKERRTRINLSIMPLAETKMTYPIQRQVLAESRPWYKVVWPSLQDLKVDYAGSIHGKWAKVTLVKTGATWKNRDGETVEETAIKFLALYDTEQECLNAYYDALGTTPSDSGNTAPSNGTQAHTNGHNGSDAGKSDQEKETAKQFLKVLVNQFGNDRAKLAEQIAGMKLVNKYFTVDSPEVAEMLN